VKLVGLGQLGPATVHAVQDGSLPGGRNCGALVKAGAWGKIIGLGLRPPGQLIEGLTNDRVASVKRERPAKRRASPRPWVRPKPVASQRPRGRLVSASPNETMAKRLLGG